MRRFFCRDAMARAARIATANPAGLTSSRVSVAAPLWRGKGGQFVCHAGVLPGNPHGGPPLATTSPAISRQPGAAPPKTGARHIIP